MKCAEVRIKLSEYLDGELSAEERKVVESHLEGCDECRRELQELERAVGHVHSLEEVEPPPWFAQNVMQRVRAEAEPKKGLLRRLFHPLHVKLPAEALAVALVAVAAVYVFNAIRPEVKMKVATEPLAEAPAPVAQDKIAALRDEASAGEQALGWHEAEDRADALMKSAEPAYRAKKQEEISEKKAYAPPPPALREEAAPAEGGAGVKGDTAFEEAYYEPDAERRIAEREEFRMSLVVRDLSGAREDVEKALARVGGRIIEKEPAKENVIFAEVDPAEIAELIKELEAVGKVSAGAHEVFGGPVRVRIELSERP